MKSLPLLRFIPSARSGTHHVVSPLRFILLRTLCFLLLSSFGIAAHAEDFDEGRAAANRGEFATAFSIWKPLAEQGDPRSSFALGRMYARGDGVARNFAQARKYFDAAALGGHAPAYLAIGKLFFYGDGVKQDNDSAYRYFSEAARLGVAEAPLFLSKLKGKVTNAALIPLPTAAPQIVALTATPTSTPLVAPEFATASPSVSPVAISTQSASLFPSLLTSLFPSPAPSLTPSASFTPMVDLATPAPTMAATPTVDDPLAPYRSFLGSASRAENRVFRFDPVAEAVIRGFPGGKDLIPTYNSSIYFSPIIADEKQLANNIAQANAGSAESQNILGFAAYFSGKTELAQSWFEKSAHQGNGVALFALGNFAFDNSYEQAAKYYEQAAAKGIVAAKRNLGYFLLRGIGVDQNKERGRIYLTEASRLGDAIATDLLK